MRFDFPFRTRSLKYKLILSYLVILGIGGLVTSIVGSYIVSSTMMSQAQRTVEHDLAAARTVFDQDLGALRQAVWLLADGLAERGARTRPGGDAAALTLADVREGAGFDFLAVTDAAGRVTYRVVNPGTVGDDVSDRAVIRSALSGTVAAAVELVPAAQLAREDPALREQARTPLVATPRATPTDRVEETDGLVLLAAAPIRGEEGALRGTLYGGVLLNHRFEMVDRMWGMLYGGERRGPDAAGSVTIFQRDIRIATTVRDDRGARAVGTRVSAEVAEAVLGRGETWHDRAFAVNDWYFTAYEPLRNLEGAIVGILYVGVLERAYASTRNRVILSFFALATVGFIMIIGLTYAMISNITRPIGEMVAATRSITAGRFDQEVRATAQGEITLLAESFNTMLASLRQMKADLEEWGNTLERKVHERTDQLMRMQVRVAQSERLASLGMLAAGVAHEINNPLGGILSLTALTLEDLPADHPDRHNLEVVVRQTERCRDIVKGLLDFSRQSAAMMEDEDVNDILAQTLALVSKQAAFFNVQVVQHWAPDLPHVTADRQQLQQVFLNLLVNAVQAMGEQGTITITTRSADDGAAAEVVIADTGSGIPPDLIDRIFDPFFTTKQGGTGTGLGLAIAYGIVTRHHGTISVESEVGKGTTFTIRLPAAAPVPAMG
jgi:two-component system NtrC family sensor kinase